MQVNQKNLVLDHNYTQGVVKGYSGNENDGVFTNGGGILKHDSKYAYLPKASNSRITVSDSPELQLTAGTFSVYAELVNGFDAVSVFLDKRDAGGTNYTLYIASATTIGFLVSAGVVNFPISSNQFIGVDVITVTKSAGLSKAKLYFDGVFISESFSSFTLVANDADLIIGNDYVGTGRTINAIYSTVIHSDEKDPTEVSDIYEALITRKSQEKPNRNFDTSPSVGVPTTGSAWNVDAPNWEIVDQSGKYNGSITNSLTTTTGDGLSQGETVWGEPSLKSNKQDGHINLGAASDLTFDGTDTIFGYAGWFTCDSAASQMLMSRSVQYFFQKIATGALELSLGGNQFSTPLNSFVDNVPHLFSFFADENNVYIYVDGEFVISEARTGTIGVGTLRIGQYVVSGFSIQGEIGPQPFYREFTDLAEYESVLKAEWNRVANKIVYSEDFSDAYVMDSAVSGAGNHIPGTEWSVKSTSGQIVDGVNIGEKSITGAAVGAILEAFMADHAFGVFEVAYEAVAGSRCRYNLTEDAVFSIADFGGVNSTISIIPSAGGGMTGVIGALTDGNHIARIEKKANKVTLNATLYNDGILVPSATGSNPYTDITDVNGKQQVAPYGTTKIHSIVQYFGVPL